MKIRHLKLERFKRFADYELDFTHPDSGQPLDLVVLVGENGSGKSTILQAIALALAKATFQIGSLLDMSWPGLDMDSISFNYQGSWGIRLNIEFNDEELNATREYAQKSNGDIEGTDKEVGNDNHVQLVFQQKQSSIRALDSNGRVSKRTENQFLGRRFAYNLMNTKYTEPDMFRFVGGVYWYHDQRTTYHMTPFPQNRFVPDFKRISDTADLRRLITNWFAAEGQPKVKRFRGIYEQLFPGKTLSRIGDTFSNEAPPVFFRDENGTEYELAELSGGESVLMPLLLDFVQWDINNSVILIDEIELHLHPPLQQTLIAMLPKLGENNQFIITTHSDAVFNVVPSTSVKRINAVVEAVNG